MRVPTDASFNRLMAKAIREEDHDLLEQIEIVVINQMQTQEERDSKLELISAVTEMIEA